MSTIKDENTVKLKYLFLVSFFLTACATTQNQSDTNFSNSYNDSIELPQDPHSQAIIDILRVMSIPQIARVAMNKKLAEDETQNLSPEYIQCINEQLTDNQVYALMLPVYKNNIDQESAIKLAEFYTGTTGQKISTILKIKLGESLPQPSITQDDVLAMAKYRPLLEELKKPELQEQARVAGYNLGIQMGLQCAATGSI